jgi:hypothetical protein
LEAGRTNLVSGGPSGEAVIGGGANHESVANSEPVADEVSPAEIAKLVRQAGSAASRCTLVPLRS